MPLKRGSGYWAGETGDEYVEVGRARTHHPDPQVCF